MIEKIIYWVHRRLSSLKPALIMSTLAITFFAVPAHSQANDREKLMAVMTVLNMYLLSDREKPIDPPGGPGMKIELGFGADQPLTPGQNETPVSGNQYFEFDLQDEGVELCFFIDSNSVINENDLVIEVNGRAQAAYYGENCVSVGRGAQRDINYINLIVNANGLQVGLSAIEFVSSSQSQLLLPRTTRGEWDEKAVRKVLKIFAFGGHATDEQIFEWSIMRPAEAIVEMLNFDEHNLKLSPLGPNERYTTSATQHGKLWDWQEFLRADASYLPIPATIPRDNQPDQKPRRQYGLNGYNFDDAYNRMITVRGLNPFRQRIGFWETNYHLAVNQDASVDNREIAAYYDLIMEAHEAGLPYYQILGIAAKSAAVAEQYGHDRNEWRRDRETGEYYCQCNDDFAREVHQLFFGIFGADDPEHHESVTIPNTARMLTDMPRNNFTANGTDDENISQPSDVRVNFGTDDHYNSNGGEPLLSILKLPIPHSSTAAEKIDYLMPLSMQHAESLHNLPIMVIEGLADNNLNEGKRNRLRASWASMGVNRVLLDFIQAYAISDLFHSNSQTRYFTSHERALYIANKHNHNNIEAYFGGGGYNGGRLGLSVGGVINDDNAGDFFRPIHNVFGGQSPLESADSALSFENNFNRFTQYDYNFRNAIECDECDDDGSTSQAWEKPWAQILPRAADGNFYVADVAEWLWNHAVGSLEGYTELERAHLHSILGAARQRYESNGEQHREHQNHWLDFTMLMCIVRDYQREVVNPDLSLSNILTSAMHQHCSYYGKNPRGYDQDEIDDINTAYTGQQIADDPLIQSLLAELGQETLPLDASGDEQSDRIRYYALDRISNALAFIFNTPFVFAEAQQ